MNKPLKQAVTDKLEAYALNEGQLQQLELLAERAPAARRQPAPVFRYAIAGAVAAFLLAFVLTP